MKKHFYLIGILGIVFIAASLINLSVNNWVWSVFSIVLLALGGLMCIAYVIKELETIKKFFSKRSTIYGSNAVISIIVAFAILLVINWIVDQKTVRVDVTAGRQFSLADQTVNILQNLNKEVKFTCFFKSGEQGRVEDLLSEYEHHSGKVSYEFVDPDKSPAIAKNYGITQYNTVVVECGDKSEKITSSTENDLTNALIKVTREGKKVVYFTDGHGERDIESVEREGYSQIKEKIENENYEVKKLFIAQEETFPSDCAVLIINSPKTEFFPGELDTIKAYLNNGGKVLWLLDPDSPVDKDFFKEWGIEILDKPVVDASGIGQFFGLSAAAPLVNKYGNHVITNDFRNTATFYPLARAIIPEETPGEDITITKLCETTSRSWAESDKSLNGRVEFNEESDIRGPISIAVVITKTLERAYLPDQEDKNAQMVVFGDADFASNLYHGNAGNGDLFLNTVNWLAEEEDLISIRPKDPEDRRVSLSGRQTKLMFWFVMVILPAIIILSGVYVYINRRKG